MPEKIIIDIERTVSLDKLIAPEALPGALYGGEDQAHRFIIGAMVNKAAYALTGRVTGSLINWSTKQTQPLDGTIENGKAVVILPASCYVHPGRVTITLFVTNDNTIAVYSCSASVMPTQTDEIIDPEDVLNLSELAGAVSGAQEAAAEATAAAASASRITGAIAVTEATSTATFAYETGSYFFYDGTLYRATSDIAIGDTITPYPTTGHNCRAVTVGAELARAIELASQVSEGAVRYDEAQTLTEAQKLRARENIGATVGAVRYDIGQELTTAQKAQARINIGITDGGGGGGAATCVTPEMYGAVGDGETDDGPALQAALASGHPVVLTQNLYVSSNIVVRDMDVFLDGQGRTIFLHGKDMTGNVANGANLSYQWQYKRPNEDYWIDVSMNGRSATYNLVTASRHNGFKYKCIVSNSEGSVASIIATLTVLNAADPTVDPEPVISNTEVSGTTPPHITRQPKSVVVVYGETATFHVEAGIARGGDCIDLGATWNDGIIEDADVVIYTETSTAMMNPAFPERNAYHRGYLSYHGFNPTPDRETYSEYSTHSWKECRVIVKNCRFVGDHTDGLKYLRLNSVCHSAVDHCDFICTTDDGASIGIQVNYGYDVMVNGIYAENFTANTSRRILSTGYAIQAIGDAITISNCILKNCKNHINLGGGSGNSGIFTTGAIMDNIVLETRDTGEKTVDGSNANLYQQMLDLHEGCHKPIVSNILMIYDNALGADNYGTLVNLSCPEAVISNVVCKFAKAWGNWAIGVFGFGPLAKRMWFENLHAPGCYLHGHGWGYERGNAYDANYMREINVVGGEIGGIIGGSVNQGLLKYRLASVRVSGLVNCARLWAENCVFKNENRLNSGAQIIISQEAFFSGCDISGYTLGTYVRSTPVIQAPANSVYMTGCVIRKPLDENTFKTEQIHLVNNAEWDLYGLVLGSRVTADYADGDECALGQYNLW